MKILKIIVGFLVCISLIRAINDAKPLSTYELLMQIEKANFKIISIEDIEYMLEAYKEYNRLNTQLWDNELDGIDGFLENLKNVFITGTLIFLESFSLISSCIIDIIKNILKGILDLLKIALYICGFAS